MIKNLTRAVFKKRSRNVAVTFAAQSVVASCGVSGRSGLYRERSGYAKGKADVHRDPWSLGQPRRWTGLIQLSHLSTCWQTLGPCEKQISVLSLHLASYPPPGAYMPPTDSPSTHHHGRLPTLNTRHSNHCVAATFRQKRRPLLLARAGRRADGRHAGTRRGCADECPGAECGECDGIS